MFVLLYFLAGTGIENSKNYERWKSLARTGLGTVGGKVLRAAAEKTIL
jgi:hypothetical protein